MKTNNVWFVTGASKGLGLAMVKTLLTKGYKVAATSRNKKELENVVGKQQDFLALEVSLTDEESIKNAISETVSTFGAIDVVVNNAGYGQIGTLEELSDKEIRQNYEINVFGSLNIIRNVMPYLRKQGSGHIFNIASIAGYTGSFPGWGSYTSTKFAVVGFTESLAAEAKPLGINATVVYPGYFRTNFLNKDAVATPLNQIEDYKNAREVQKKHEEEINGNQLGDPDKAAEAIIKISEVENPPVHLFLGSDAYEVVGGKNAVIKQDLETWKELTLSTDFAG
ncbi:MAG: short-chain dehydrogenase/reductase [Thalassobius sp.]|nr:short-chain dehydrogenase/reductase [Thalassovita sp.]